MLSERAQGFPCLKNIVKSLSLSLSLSLSRVVENIVQCSHVLDFT